VVQAPNDKQQIEPMLTTIGALPEDLGKPDTLLADNGYFSEANVALCAAARIAPMIAGPAVTSSVPAGDRCRLVMPARIDSHALPVQQDFLISTKPLHGPDGQPKFLNPSPSVNRTSHHPASPAERTPATVMYAGSERFGRSL
jgi:hypothetical protein